MEATFWAKRALFNVPKFLPSSGLQSASRVTTACFSSAFERAEGSNAVVEGEGSTEITDAPLRDTRRDDLYETKHPNFVTGEGRPPGSTAADSANDGVKKAVEMAENVGDAAKQTLDGAWRAAKGTAQGIKDSVSNDDGDDDDEIEEDVAVDEVRKVDQLVDTQEYRSIEELRTKAGGYDKAP